MGKLNRRTILAASPAILAAPAVALAAHMAGPDDEVVRRCEAFLAVDRRMVEWSEYSPPPGDKAAGAYDAVTRENCEEWDKLLRAVIALPATTPAGFRAKGAVMRAAVQLYSDSQGTIDGSVLPTILAWCLAHELQGEPVPYMPLPYNGEPIE